MRRSAATLTLALLAGCGPTPAKLQIEPASLQFTSAGDAVVLIVGVLDAEGKAIKQHKPCTFTSSNREVVEAGPDGAVRSVSSGAAEVAVACGKLSAAVPVRVRLPVKIAVKAQCRLRCKAPGETTRSVALEGVGASAKLDARALDDAGEAVPVEIRYEVSDPEYQAKVRPPGFEVSADGVLKALNPGRYLLFVHAGTVTEKIEVAVTMPQVDVVKATQPRLVLKPGAHVQLAARAFRRAKRSLEPVGGAKLAWSSSNPEVAKVDADGALTALLEGTAEVLVAAESGAFAQVFVQVASAPAKKPAPRKGK